MTKRILFLIALLVAFAAPGHGSAEDGNGGNNTAVAINVKDDSSLFKFAFSIKKVTGEVVDNGNAAVAFASCQNCRTTAIAIQIVLVSGSPETVTPENVAISINQECTSCQTFSTAFQFVLGVSDPSVGLTVEGKRQLREILREFRALQDEDYTLEEFHAKTQALGQRLRTVLQTELQSRRPEEDDDAVLDVEEDEEVQEEQPAPPEAPPAETTTGGETTAPATTESTPTETSTAPTETTPPPPTTTTP
jgi:putative peptide zinc metalloprotease protein